MATDSHVPLQLGGRPSSKSFWAIGLLVVAGIVALLLVGEWAAKADSSLDDRLAAIDARTEAYESTFASVYGATDVHYTGNEVTMTVGDKSYECESPKVEELSDRPTLRCTQLVHVDAVAIPAL